MTAPTRSVLTRPPQGGHLQAKNQSYTRRISNVSSCTQTFPQGVHMHQEDGAHVLNLLPRPTREGWRGGVEFAQAARGVCVCGWESGPRADTDGVATAHRLHMAEAS